MAATVCARHGLAVTIYERNRGPAGKLLIAGGSGLNISNTLALDDFAAQYAGDAIDWPQLLRAFSPTDWLGFIHEIGLETFAGTSGRYFVKGMKASGLLRAWLSSLGGLNVRFQYSCELVDFHRADSNNWELSFASGIRENANAVVLALGGASWLRRGQVLSWPAIFAQHNIEIQQFAPANCGFNVAWKPEFLAEAVRQPLKNIVFTSAAGSKKGDILITSYGLEGTPVYTYGRTGNAKIDLKPDMPFESLFQKMAAIPENLSPLRRAKKVLGLQPAALALLYHHAPQAALSSIAEIVQLIKHFPLELGEPRALEEAISSTGGIALAEINAQFELNKLPGCFAVGEMLNWHAPTGGFLIQACVSQGYVAGAAIAQELADNE
jgi:uncharacterized flavoprotein (TIGR03862 family)